MGLVVHVPGEDEMDLARRFSLSGFKSTKRLRLVSRDVAPDPCKQIRFAVMDVQRFTRAVPGEVWLTVTTADPHDAETMTRVAASIYASGRVSRWKRRAALLVARIGFALVNLAVPVLTGERRGDV